MNAASWPRASPSAGTGLHEDDRIDIGNCYTIMMFALTMLNDLQIHCIDAEQAFIQPAVEEEIYTTPQKYEPFRVAVGKPNRS